MWIMILFKIRLGLVLFIWVLTKVTTDHN